MNENPADLASLNARRLRIADALPPGDAVLLAGAGTPVPLPEESDQTYPFRSHAHYYYLAGHECAGGLLAYDPQAPAAEQWVSFVPAVTEAGQIWEGRTQTPGRPLADFPQWLEARRHRTLVSIGAPIPGVATDAALNSATLEAVRHARRPKDQMEIALSRRAIAATAVGFEAIRAHLRPGVTERSLQIELEAGFFRGGGTRTGYSTIVGSGPNSAVLHFEPSSRIVREGEFVLVDAGDELDRYTADVTRTYVAGTPNPFQRDLYQVVLEAEERAIRRCVVGAEWKDIHFAAAHDLTAGLVAMGVLRGEPASLVEQEAHTLFFSARHRPPSWAGRARRQRTAARPNPGSASQPPIAAPGPSFGSRLPRHRRARDLFHPGAPERRGAPVAIRPPGQVGVGGPAPRARGRPD